eukprot:Awhi_evm1s10571
MTATEETTSCSKEPSEKKSYQQLINFNDTSVFHNKRSKTDRLSPSFFSPFFSSSFDQMNETVNLTDENGLLKEHSLATDILEVEYGNKDYDDISIIQEVDTSERASVAVNRLTSDKELEHPTKELEEASKKAMKETETILNIDKEFDHPTENVPMMEEMEELLKELGPNKKSSEKEGNDNADDGAMVDVVVVVVVAIVDVEEADEKCCRFRSLLELDFGGFDSIAGCVRISKLGSAGKL